MEYQSNAEWPEGVYKDSFGINVSSDTHSTRDTAVSVCKRLEKEGFGGEGKHFPIRTWVSIAKNTDQCSE